MESAINKCTPRYYNDIIIVTVDPHMTMWTKPRGVNITIFTNLSH